MTEAIFLDPFLSEFGVSQVLCRYVELESVVFNFSQIFSYVFVVFGFKFCGTSEKRHIKSRRNISEPERE